MPSYYLHLHNAHVDASDDEGVDVVDLLAAKAKAVEGIRGFLAHEVIRGTLDLRGRVDIADGAGTILLTVPFADAVAVVGFA